MECIGHIRLLSWLLLGSLTHTALQGGNYGQIFNQPISQESSCQIADHIQVIMAGFAEQPKTSVLHMSSLFHTFILCQVCYKINSKQIAYLVKFFLLSLYFQLWTIYLEQGLASHTPLAESSNVTMNILFDFWGKVTPCILQLIQQSKTVRSVSQKLFGDSHLKECFFS